MRTEWEWPRGGTRRNRCAVADVWGGDPLTQWDTPLWQHSLDNGLRLLRQAVESHLITSHHALPLVIRHAGGVVIEVTDGTEDYNRSTYRGTVFYDLAKVAVTRLGFSQGHELRAHGATAVSLTPGWLRSEMMLDLFGVTEDNWRDALVHEPHFCISESPRYVGRAVVALATDPTVARFNASSLTSGQLAQEYGFTDTDGSRPQAWRYLAEVHDRGLPADATGYR